MNKIFIMPNLTYAELFDYKCFKNFKIQDENIAHRVTDAT